MVVVTRVSVMKCNEPYFPRSKNTDYCSLDDNIMIYFNFVINSLVEPCIEELHANVNDVA